ncbi:CRTAC1 family protein [Coleofasciculus chthonoplastes]|uniref:CRTAC1 family protein n=1 Tax=Coleofasciculus chthonoplastes TaxID=64178 RepID=UPI0033038591
MIKRLKTKSLLVTIRTLALVICTAILVIGINYIVGQPANEELNLSTENKTWFTSSPLRTHEFRLFDLGVVDVNYDKNLDIFTSNHNHSQLLLLGEGNGEFTKNRISSLRLDQDHDFPGLEYSGTEPKISNPGIYIYWKDRSLIIKNNKNNNSVQGIIQLSSPLNVKENKQFNVNVTEDKLASGAIVSTLEFKSESNDGKLVFTPHNVSLPINFNLGNELPLDSVFVGNQFVNPQSHEFSLYLRDRHGMAWADYDDAEGMVDVFIVRGGLKGRMDKIPERFSDELLVDQGNLTFQDITDQSGIVKDGCPALQTAWVDFNADNRLDIYTVCYQAAGRTATFPNQLYRQDSDGTFVNVASQTNLDLPNMGTFAWLDADRDRDIDLVWVDEKAFWLYVNDSGQFKPQLIGSNPGSVIERFEDSNKLTVADYDADGDLDVFFASPNANALLINNRGTYEVVEPQQVGLPTQALTANWVDYDNDGLTDLHLIPGGLYRQGQDHKFTATQMLEVKSPELLESRATWLDADNDGDRDLLLATRYHDSILNRVVKKVFAQSPLPSFWQVKLYSNIGATNHWLQVQLIGLPKNRQAIGSHVEVITSDGVQVQTVGQAEGSHFSQGHYRLYFGLGQTPQVDSIKIVWSDGELQEIKNPPIDQLLTIEKD